MEASFISLVKPSESSRRFHLCCFLSCRSFCWFRDQSLLSLCPSCDQEVFKQRRSRSRGSQRGDFADLEHIVLNYNQRSPTKRRSPSVLPYFLLTVPHSSREDVRLFRVPCQRNTPSPNRQPPTSTSSATSASKATSTVSSLDQQNASIPKLPTQSFQPTANIPRSSAAPLPPPPSAKSPSCPRSSSPS